MDGLTSIFQVGKQLTFQPLIAESTVEVLDVLVLPGTPFSDAQCLHASLVELTRHHVRN